MKKTDNINHIISEMTVLYQKLRHFHWHVEGKHFFALHEKFEEIYNDVNQIIDILAERVVGLQQKSITSLNQALELATEITENTSHPNDQEMVQELISDLEKISKLLSTAAGDIDEFKDRHTVNLLDESLDTIEHHVWMLKALKV